MNDFLIELGKNPQARNLIRSLGLPIPLPQALRRAKGPWTERPVHDRKVVVGAAAGGALGSVLAQSLTAAGANPVVVGDEEAAQPYADWGEAYGRPPELIGAEPPERFKADALVFDATGIDAIGSLESLHGFFHPFIKTLARSGRILVLGRPPRAQAKPEAAAAQGALNGFARTLAKEVGRKGSTAQLVYVEEGAEDRLAAVVRFLLSPRSAYMTGQVLELSAVAKGAPEPIWVRPLDGKVALVTGAARGIGKATARLLAAEGAHVVCLDRPEDDGPASKVAREVGGSVLLLDVSAADAPSRVAQALEEKGGVDVVVHNAGITRDRTIARMKAERWNEVIDVNLVAVEAITRALLDGPLHDGGRIICLSSIAGIAGNMGQTNYAASKSGVIGYVQQLAPVVAERGITVNAVAPGFIETRLTARIPMVIREVGRRLNSLSQAGLPQDVGEVIAFLASPGAAGLTGSVLRVCGGMMLGA